MLNLVLDAARKRGLVRVNPVSDVDRPAAPRRRWTILSPVQIGAVERAFAEMIAAAETDADRDWCEQCRIVFVTVMGSGMRRGEILGLRWRNVHLADPDGASLRVVETWVRGAAETPKSESSERTIALGRKLAAELFDHRGGSAFAGDDERVFCQPQTGAVLDHKRYAATLRAAFAKAGVTEYVRPFHDGRHTSVTNGAKAGMSPAALMASAGHSDFATTPLYIDLAGEAFRDETELLEQRLWNDTGTKSRYQEAASSPDQTTATVVQQG